MQLEAEAHAGEDVGGDVDRGGPHAHQLGVQADVGHPVAAEARPQAGLRLLRLCLADPLPRQPAAESRLGSGFLGSSKTITYTHILKYTHVCGYIHIHILLSI